MHKENDEHVMSERGQTRRFAAHLWRANDDDGCVGHCTYRARPVPYEKLRGRVGQWRAYRVSAIYRYGGDKVAVRHDTCDNNRIFQSSTATNTPMHP